MACTTILVGKNASNNGSTMIARNDDGFFTEKKLKIVEKNKNGEKYISKISKVEVDLPKKSYRYSLVPNVDLKDGIWGAAGINERNVGMSATETITSNPRVLGADPLCKKIVNKKLMPQGIGEEDLVVLTLPYISSARAGVIRLGSLIEKYGTYESNGIAFNDKDEIWWLETIGGHHWIAKKIKDDEVVIMPNQFGLDNFDFVDAYGKKTDNLCSEDLKEFLKENSLDLNLTKSFNPRLAFGSMTDADHVYNTPRSWDLIRFLNKKMFKENAYEPEDDDLPWSFKPDRKLTVEDVKYALSLHYQGTKYDPYAQHTDSKEKGKYRPIGISRTSFMALLEIRNNVPSEISAIEWICYGSNVFNTFIPLYMNTSKVPTYLSNTTMDVNTNNFFWASRLLGCLTDPFYSSNIIHIERYQNETMSKAHEVIKKYDELISKDISKANELIDRANEEITEFVKKETNKTLRNVLMGASMKMKNGYSRGDN